MEDFGGDGFGEVEDVGGEAGNQRGLVGDGGADEHAPVGEGPGHRMSLENGINERGKDDQTLLGIMHYVFFIKKKVELREE